MNDIEQCRDAFEDWARNKPDAPAYFGRSNGGYYIEDDVAALWEGWKAAWIPLAEQRDDLLSALQEIVINDPYKQSAAGKVAAHVIAKVEAKP